MIGSNGNGSTPNDGEPFDPTPTDSSPSDDTIRWQKPQDGASAHDREPTVFGQQATRAEDAASTTELSNAPEAPTFVEATQLSPTAEFAHPLDADAAADSLHDELTELLPQAPAAEKEANSTPLSAASATPAVPDEAAYKRPRQPHPWYRKPLYIGIAAALALALILAIAIPLVMNLNKAKHGDRLADAYTTALATHDQTWTEERLASIEAISLADTLEEKRDFFTQSMASMKSFDEQCKAVESAAQAMAELQAAPMPTLVSEPGADASEKYRQAQATASANEAKAAAEQELVTKGNEALAVLSEFCLTLPQYNTVYNQYLSSLETSLKPTLTLQEGDKVTLEGGKKWTCNSAEGCPDLTDQDNRTKFADAFDASTTTFYSTFSDLAKKQCFLSSMQTVCDAYASEWSAAATSYKAATDSLRNNEPTVEAGSPLYPDFESNVQAASEHVKAGDAKVAEAWKGIDPDATDQDKTGWQSRSLKRILSGHQDALTGYVNAVRQAAAT